MQETITITNPESILFWFSVKISIVSRLFVSINQVSFDWNNFSIHFRWIVFIVSAKFLRTTRFCSSDVLDANMFRMA